MDLARHLSALWERQPCDDDRSWPHFVAYRDQTLPRKLSPLRCTRGGVTPPLESLLSWYRDHNWRDRVAAYDAHIDDLLRAEREAVLVDRENKSAARLADLLEDGKALLSRELAKMLAESEAVDFARMKPNEIARLLEVVVKVDRLSQGKSTENHTHDLSALSLDEVRALEALHRKAEKGK